MRCKSFDLFFQNFANKTKLDIILVLKDVPLSVNQIAEKLEQEQSKISHNLRKLIQCNILKVEQQGKQRIYSLNKDTVLPMLRLVEKHVKHHCPECTKELV
tara:strand:+ start:470 stop:772 length:303 start_codon:yes stop_codon:yes gene_type:complete